MRFDWSNVVTELQRLRDEERQSLKDLVAYVEQMYQKKVSCARISQVLKKFKTGDQNIAN